MNILLYHSNEISPQKGGISRITFNLKKLFEEKGHKVWFLASKKLNLIDTYNEDQYFLPDVEIVNSLTNQLFLTRLIDDLEINVIINQNPFILESTLLLANSRKKYNKRTIKLISCYHNSILTPIKYYSYQKELLLDKYKIKWIANLLRTKVGVATLLFLYKKINRRKYQVVLKESDFVLLLCEGQVDEFCEVTSNNDKSKIKVINNYIDEHSLAKKDEKQNIVLWVGTFDYSIKRPDYMLKIWKEVENQVNGWKLLLLGDGPSLDSMKKMATEMGLKNIAFEGRVNPMGYYAKSKVLCMTSIHECFPMVSLEAFINGLPVFAFNSFTSAKVLVKDGNNGVLIEPFRVKEYSQKLIALLNEQNRLIFYSKNAEESIIRFSKDAIYEKWEQMLSE